jgi:hypothetical protein
LQTFQRSTLSGVDEAPAGSLPLDIRELAEALAAAVGLTVGRCTIELRFEDGVLHELFRHDRTPASALEARFGWLASETAE